MQTRFALVWLLAAAYGVISLSTRAALSIQPLATGLLSFADLPQIFARGAGNDMVTVLYLAVPLSLYLALVPERWYHRRWHRVLAWSGFALTLFGLFYLAAVEYFFFEEFNSRFNFVAVEYLIYPHEVFVNIWQSYPVAQALFASTTATALLLWLMRQPIMQALAVHAPLPRRLVPVLVLLAATSTVFVGVNPEAWRTNRNRVADELAANGIYSFFSAARNNHLDYTQFYATLEDAEAVRRVRRIVAQPNAEFIHGAPNPIARRITYAGAPKPLHVIVLLQESLGAEFVGAYGAQRSYTPNLDRIARDSLVFTHTYASGTRTVRGMEAVTASFPPVPAESIVKRTHNEGMFNWSTVMRKNGYSPTFIYGGFGTFDNMNYFFGNNGYRVIDRTQMDEPKFRNIWGVSDEDLFRNALREFDAQIARGERIFSVVMSTSNHKPFTFPEGVEGVAPHGGGREAGVRYADYAIGRFIEALRKKPYFDNTMVVIVADHGARVYGREDIPLPTYEIPFLVYSPKHVAPRRFDELVSQIDVAPTVLGLLNISYDSVFFGKDALLATPNQRYAVLNHNRDIALYHDQQLAKLGFQRSSTTLTYDPATRKQTPQPADDEALRDAASFYQLAYEFYTKRLYRMD